MSGLVDEHPAVGVAVVGDTEVGVGRADERPQVFEVLGDGFGVTAGEVAVGLGVDGVDLTAEFAEQVGTCKRASSVAGVDDDSEVGSAIRSRSTAASTCSRYRRRALSMAVSDPTVSQSA